MGMGHPLIDKIVDDGVHSINVSMLSPELRNALLTEAGSKLIHMNRVEEAAEVFALAGNQEKLWDHGRWFMEQQRYGLAALFLRHVARHDILEDLAAKCLERNDVKGAKAIYEVLQNTQMVRFLEENFA